MTARIYKPCRTAMQSGVKRTKEWILEYIPQNSRFIDPIMGWTGAEDMMANEVSLHFDTKEEAIAYASKHNIEFKLEEPNEPKKRKPRPYVDNYKYHPLIENV